MKNVESDQQRKEKLLQRLRSLSPTARKAVLMAALEEKALRVEIQKYKEQEEKYGSLFAENEIFTADIAIAARRRLKEKLTPLNGVIDPEIE